MTSTPEHPDFRTWLARMDDPQLAKLLRARPDVAQPLPPSITPLAGRLQLRASVSRALRALNALELAVLEAASDLGAEFSPVAAETIVDSLSSRANVDRELATEAVQNLVDQALLYGDHALMLVTEAMSVLPASWRLLGANPDTPKPLSETIAELEPAQRKVLDTLAAAGGLGHSRDAAIDADPARPIPRLIEAGLLTRVDSGHVRLPRPVSQVLRGEDPVDYPLAPSARMLSGTSADDDAQLRADQAGAAQGLETTRRLARLLDHLSIHPVALNKDGTVGVRAVGALVKQFGSTDDRVHRLIGLGTAAGLVGRGDVNEAPHLAPAKDIDEWLDADLPEQWARVLKGWWASPFSPWRIGGRDDNDQPIRLLSPAMRLPHLPSVRRLIAEQYTRPSPGSALNDDELLADLRFTAPLVTAATAQMDLDGLREEFQWIGAVAGGTATSALRALLADPASVSEATAAVTPAEVDRVIIQGDRTILAPGPLPTELQKQLELMADLESPGLASVYRISEDSIRRALDAGRTSEEIEAWFTEHSLGEVPQSLGYLVGDVARRHGNLRGGPALSYLRCQDPTLLESVMRSPAAGTAGLTRLAPTVAISQSRLGTVIEILREAGFQPVAENHQGAAVDISPPPARVPAEKLRGPVETTIDEARIQAAVKAIRRGDSDQAETRVVQGLESLSVLQAAARGGKTVTLGFVDKHGQALQATVKPLTVNAGQVDAVDEKTGSVRRFQLHRITQVFLD